MITALYVLGTHALGTAHFQYDPNHRPTNPRRLAKVWVERAEKYSRATNDLALLLGVNVPPSLPLPVANTPPTQPNNSGLYQASNCTLENGTLGQGQP